MSKTAIVVITTVQRRRHWSAEEKERLVSASLEPGAGVCAVARQAGIHPGQLYGWRRQLYARSQPVSGFTPVRIAAQPPPGAMASAGTIEIEFANGLRMRISGAVDPATLTATVAVLASGGRRR